MTAISLRAYNREINQMVEDGRPQDAIEHCLHILGSYPKHIDTYRLLATAYIETHAYGDAADIFQRVLSVIPDDLVAHLGLSVIREHEDNLDDAVAHMERAFEVQPANRIINAELQRLYGLRDGLRPTRIYLTRPALARMYFKGILIQQAIAEIEACLSEDSSRLDLMLLLARIYRENGQLKEATITGSSILEKLPYCLEANIILAETNVMDVPQIDKQIHRSRIQQIDPYYAFITPEIKSSDNVSDIAVIINVLDSVSRLGGEHPPGGSDEIVDAALLAGESRDQVQELPTWIRDLDREDQSMPEESANLQEETIASDSRHSGGEQEFHSIDDKGSPSKPAIEQMGDFSDEEDTKPVRVADPNSAEGPHPVPEDPDDTQPSRPGSGGN